MRGLPFVTLRRGVINIIILFSVCYADAQEKDSGWFATERFSFTLSSGYHFNPWQNYNQALETISRQIRLDISFYEPQGFYEKIVGDGSLKAMIGYDIRKNWQLLCSGQYGHVDSRFQFEPDRSKPQPYYSNQAIDQKLSFNVWSFGLGVQRDIPISKKIMISPAVELNYNLAKLDFNYHYAWAWDTPLAEKAGEKVSTKFKSSDFGASISAGISYQLSGNLSIFCSGEYRWIEFDKLSGSATLNYWENETYGFSAELVEAENYFGLRVTDKPENFPYLTDLSFYTYPGPEARRPATIDWSSFGLTMGIKMRF